LRAPATTTEEDTMKGRLVLTLAAAALLGACAQTTRTADAGRDRAEQRCSELARMEGLAFVDFTGTEAPAAGEHRVRMRVQDRIGRRFLATCRYVAASNSVAWAEALPKFQR
jgi:hypothetical protein